LTEQTYSSGRILIAAKRLDADERERTAIEVDKPRSEAGQQAQLIELVHARYPEAEFRSYVRDEKILVQLRDLREESTQRRALLASIDRLPPAEAA